MPALTQPPTIPTVPTVPAPLAAVPVVAIAALSLAALATGVSMRLADPLLPRLAAEFSASLGQVSMVITVFAVAYGLAQLLFGPLGDRFGKYRVIGWACAASAVTSLACALSQDLPSLMLARLAAGTSAAAVIPLAMAWIGDVVAYERRQAVLARFLIGQITGFAMGVWGAGYAAEHGDWRSPFFAVAGLYTLAALVLQVVRRRLPASAARPPGAPGNALQRTLREFGAVLALPWARVVLLTVLLEGASLYGPFAFIASHLHLRFSLPLSTVGALVMGFAAGGLCFALAAPVLVRRLGEGALVRGGSGLMAAALLTLAVAPRWGWAVPACMALGLGFQMMHNTLQTHATQMAPERRGAAVAAFACSLFLGNAIGVALAGALVGRVGTGWVMAAGAGGLPAVAWYFNRRRRLVMQR